DLEDRRGAGVGGEGGRPVVEEAATEAAAAVSAGPADAAQGLVAAERATRDGQDRPKEVRQAAAPPIAAGAAADPLAAYGLVVRDGAVVDGNRHADRGPEGVVSASGKPTALASAQEGAGRVARAADGPVVAERHVAEG